MSIASNKISRKNVEKLLQRKVIISDKNGDAIEVDNTSSANDIQLYIEFSKRQNCYGVVEGVYYADFMELLDCSKTTFYNSLYRLEELEYIKATPSNSGYWTVIILNNVFANEDDYKKGYMRTNVDFLYSDTFKKMSLVEKRLCLYLHLNKNTHVNLEIYPVTLAKSIGIKVISVVKAALDKVAVFFPFNYIKGKEGIKINFTSSSVVKNEETEASNYVSHIMKYTCKKYKIDHTVDDLVQIGLLAGQYIKKIGYIKFMDIVHHVIYKSSIGKYLNTKYINRLCSMESKRSRYNSQAT